MSKISTASFRGGSGTRYPFEVYNWDIFFREGLTGVYCIARRYKLEDGSFTLDPIYIGESEDLSKICGFHRKQACLQQYQANVRCVFQVQNPQRRQYIVQDLLEGYDVPCND